MKRKDFVTFLNQFGLSFQDFQKSWFNSRQIQITFGTAIQDTKEERYRKVSSYLDSVSDKGLKSFYSKIDEYISTPDADRFKYIKQEIDKRIFIAGKGVFRKLSYQLGRGTKLYRIVRLPDDDKEVSKFKEIVPIEFVKQYRLNRGDEQMFYAAFSKEIAIAETGVTDLDKYALLTYEVKSDVDLLAIVRNSSILATRDKFTAFYGAKSNEILVNIFSRPASPNGSEYELSNYIRRCNEFSLDTKHSGWIYPSVKSTNTNGIDFRTSCVAFPLEHYLNVVDLDSVKWEFSQACESIDYNY
ncbi:TPA: RES domain-containing protein [Streptococcus suis]|uniref:RES domain-containing protein n=1 Tax=Streptococcus suis TaxID=1307 RepID=UPI000CF6907B|nr:RES domain-containing protein [Streptococcus suis]HEM6340211.1 RES domain-containing protein [Streptococcus suis]HEM6398369.1 RES domain-containing protein [Streptococcus suis]